MWEGTHRMAQSLMWVLKRFIAGVDITTLLEGTLLG
jgi:hypothetical protein